MKIVIINGPNLNLLGVREPEKYGVTRFEDYLEGLKAQYADCEIEYYQSNVEGEIINKLHEVGFSVDGVVLNAGGYTHTSVALRDAIACSDVPVVEVHISDIKQREAFRHVSLLTDVCAHSIMGQGTDGYKQAIDWIINKQS